MSAVSIGERITRLAMSMREQFGSRAAEIARNQSDQADGQTREVWLSVLHRIEEMRSPTRVSEDAACLRSTADNPPAQAMAFADAAFKRGDHAVRNHWISVAFELMSDSDVTLGQTSKLTPANIDHRGAQPVPTSSASQLPSRPSCIIVADKDVRMSDLGRGQTDPE